MVGVPRHPNFRLLAAMNPATDAGKRDLPAPLRNRFTEVSVTLSVCGVRLSVCVCVTDVTVVWTSNTKWVWCTQASSCVAIMLFVPHLYFRA